MVNLCDRAIMLSQGRVAATGKVGEVVDAYVGDVTSDLERGIRDRKNRDGSGKLRFVDVHLERDGGMIDSPATGEDFDIVLAFEKHTHGVAAGTPVQLQHPHPERPDAAARPRLGGDRHDLLGACPSHGEIRCRIDRCPLPPASTTSTCVRTPAASGSTRSTTSPS